MKKFGNFQEFYEFINSNLELRGPSQPIKDFCESVEKINVGCGCQKKSRVARAMRFYLSLAHELTANDKTSIKEKTGEDIVQLHHNENLFLQF